MITPTPTPQAMESVRERVRETARRWATQQHRLVTLAVELADSGEWILDGASTAAAWLADTIGVEAGTAREWLRVGRRLQVLHASAGAFETGELSYAKIRTLTRVATPANETDLIELARTVPASGLGRAIADWLQDRGDPDAIDRHHQQRRPLSWRTDPDGTVTFTARLPPLEAGTLTAALTARVMRATPRRQPDGRPDLLTYDHQPPLGVLFPPPYHHTHQTIIDELHTRCAPCHWKRHRADARQ